MEVDKGQKRTIEGVIGKKKEKKCGTAAAPTVQQNLNKKDTLCLKLSLEPAKHYSSTN